MGDPRSLGVRRAADAPVHDPGEDPSHESSVCSASHDRALAELRSAAMLVPVSSSAISGRGPIQAPWVVDRAIGTQAR